MVSYVCFIVDKARGRGTIIVRPASGKIVQVSAVNYYDASRGAA